MGQSDDEWQRSPPSEELGTPARESFHARTFVHDPKRAYAWQVFPRVTVATITFDRHALTERFLRSLVEKTSLPIELLIVDQASQDETGALLSEFRATAPFPVRVIENRRNVGKGRALLQIRDAVPDGLLVYFDNDLELLSRYWLVHLLKAYHAHRLARGSVRVSLGLRMVNQEEYGFRHASRREVFGIPGEQNDPPRTSYAVRSKDVPDPVRALDEEIVFGWTEFLCGGVFACPVDAFREIPFEKLYPKFIGGVDTFYSDACRDLGIPLAILENGPITRHNDWPYSEEKKLLYRRLTRERAVLDRHVIAEKFLRLWSRVKKTPRKHRDDATSIRKTPKDQSADGPAS